MMEINRRSFHSGLTDFRRSIVCSKGENHMKQKKNLVLVLLIFFVIACSQDETPVAPTENGDLQFQGDALDYHDRLQGMWLGSTIANWTGLLTEGMRNEPPFYTDEDWGKVMPVRWADEEHRIDFVFQDPWLADDDTDLEHGKEDEEIDRSELWGNACNAVMV